MYPLQIFFTPETDGSNNVFSNSVEDCNSISLSVPESFHDTGIDLSNDDSDSSFSLSLGSTSDLRKNNGGKNRYGTHNYNGGLAKQVAALQSKLAAVEESLANQTHARNLLQIDLQQGDKLLHKQ